MAGGAVVTDDRGVGIMFRVAVPAGKGRMAGSAIRETGVCPSVGRPDGKRSKREKTEQDD